MKKLLLVLTILLSLTVAAPHANESKGMVDFGVLIAENPANERAELEIFTPEATDISLLIYDSQGKVLFSHKGTTQKNGGAHSLKVIWDLNARGTGRRVAAGSYAVQATARETGTGKIYQYRTHLGVRK